MKLQRRLFLLLATALALSGCALRPSLEETPPIVFVHGNGDSAALWQTTLWRFESAGWPRERLHAVDVPYPLARDDDGKAQAGRSSAAENMAFLKREVEQVLRISGASKLVLIGNSRGGNAIRNYIQNGGGDKTVSHAVLGGTPNHGVWAVKGFREGNEFSGTGPFLSALNSPKNAAGDEVTGPVKWLTIRSDNNDKYAQPDGVWIGAKGTPTNVTAAGPELKGARNVVIARIDHRETSYSQAAFEAAWVFITGKPLQSIPIQSEAVVALSGKVTGLGVDSLVPSSGSFSNNLPLPGAQLQVYATRADNGERVGPALLSQTVAADGRWGPVTVPTGAPLEFVISASGYATTHIYRSGFARGSELVHLRPERLADADKDAKSLILFSRPRGYFDPQRDRMSLDGQPLPGVPPGAGVATSRLKLNSEAQRAVRGEFNDEKITGLSWPAAQGHVAVLELSY
jgi:pimeloyl-ACP methyl ester carboxylesterase